MVHNTARRAIRQRWQLVAAEAEDAEDASCTSKPGSGPLSHLSPYQQVLLLWKRARIQIQTAGFR